jgi:hypothetical protein
MGQVVRGGEQFETHIQADHRGQLLQQGPDSGAVDSFGRLRVSQPFTMFDSILRYDKSEDKWNETISGTASSTHLPNESSVAMEVAASGDTVQRRSRRRLPYQPGKSVLVLQSFVGAPLQDGLVQEVGYFDNNNGIILRANGESIELVVRSYATGSVVENVVPQAEWNIDTAPWLNFAKANIFVCDLEWLGVGRVRAGFMVDGEYYYCHEFLHANNIDSVYMTSACLPLSYAIAATAVVSGATMKHICSSVVSEAGYEPTSPIFSITPSLAAIANTSGERIVAGIRMASGRTDNVVLPAKLDLVTESTTTIQWQLRLNPTISGVSWAAAANGRGNVETITSGSIVSGGTVIDSGLLSSAGSVEVSVPNGLAQSLGVKSDGNSEEMVLTVTSFGNAKATGMLSWREVM